jgi:hypothetical protein
MEIPTRYIWITVSVHPPEADRLADTFRAARARLVSLAAEADTTNGSLTAGWEGNQAARFLDESRAFPPDLRMFAEWAGAQEYKFRAITVAVRKQVLNPAFA